MQAQPNQHLLFYYQFQSLFMPISILHKKRNIGLDFSLAVWLAVNRNQHVHENAHLKYFHQTHDKPQWSNYMSDLVKKNYCHEFHQFVENKKAIKWYIKLTCILVFSRWFTHDRCHCKEENAAYSTLLCKLLCLCEPILHLSRYCTTFSLSWHFQTPYKCQKRIRKLVVEKPSQPSKPASSIRAP